MTASVSDRAPVLARLTGRVRATITGRFIKFAVVGGFGFVVNTATLALVSGALGVHYLAGAVVATASSTTTNFVLTDAWVFHDRAGSGRLIGRFAVFLGLSLPRWFFAVRFSSDSPSSRRCTTSSRTPFLSLP